jgi:hypothetical protein
MKTYRSFALAFLALFCAFTVSAQTADEIISKYIDAIGGRDVISKITSVYSESTMDIMGMEVPVKSTTLNGKGDKQEMNIMGSLMVTCYNDNGGWSINPFTGIGTPEDMPEAQYNSGKDQIYIGAPFYNYADRGYKAELLGTEAVGSVDAYKINLTSPENVTALHFFDPETFYLIKSVQQADMQGQTVDNVISYSDYRKTEGYAIPFKMEMDMGGGQFIMSLKVDTVIFNKPVSDSIFVKPQ